MGWETRKNGCYYYSKERHGARVESTYVGRGETAQAAAMLTEARRAAAQAELMRERAAIEKMRSEDAAFDQVDTLVMDLMKSHLIAAGYHEVKRVWRRKRARAEYSG